MRLRAPQNPDAVPPLTHDQRGSRPGIRRSGEIVPCPVLSVSYDYYQTKTKRFGGGTVLRAQPGILTRGPMAGCVRDGIGGGIGCGIGCGIGWWHKHG